MFLNFCLPRRENELKILWCKRTVSNIHARTASIFPYKMPPGVYQPLTALLVHAREKNDDYLQ
uniref:Uncharacterized protein n=1 Tax=Arion vulgaris TaxID=1028688 RepID=A0A0B6YLW4_9EUPU